MFPYGVARKRCVLCFIFASQHSTAHYFASLAVSVFICLQRTCVAKLWMRSYHRTKYEGPSLTGCYCNHHTVCSAVYLHFTVQLTIVEKNRSKGILNYTASLKQFHYRPKHTAWSQKILISLYIRLKKFRTNPATYKKKRYQLICSQMKVETRRRSQHTHKCDFCVQ